MEDDGATWIMSSSLEGARLAQVRPDAELIDVDDLGLTELVESGLSYEQVDVELAARMAARVGVRSAIVDFDFPLAIADRLRADGVELRVDFEAVLDRRRRKSEPEMDGIRKAQRAAEAAMREAALMLSRAEPDGDRLRLEGRPLTAERIRSAMREVAWQHDTLMPETVIVASVWQGTGHDPGVGPLPVGLPIEIDIWPCDTTSGCWADMTRTFVVAGEPPAEALRQERLVDQALRDALAEIRPGITGRELHAHTCDLFEADGYRDPAHRARRAPDGGLSVLAGTRRRASGPRVARAWAFRDRAAGGRRRAGDRARPVRSHGRRGALRGPRAGHRGRL